MGGRWCSDRNETVPQACICGMRTATGRLRASTWTTVLTSFPGTWSSDTDTAVATRRVSGQNDLVLLSMGEETALETLLASEFVESMPDLSPDGDWIAYESNRSGRYKIYLERFPDLGERTLVSTNGGQQPRWAPDGQTLFYLGPEADRLMFVPIENEPGLSIGSPETLVEGQFWDFRGRSGYDVGPDGRVVLIRRQTEVLDDAPPRGINVVLNWSQELAERVSAN